LSETTFTNSLHPILMARCASCHQPFGGVGSSDQPANLAFNANRFILTGNIDGDFNVTRTMVDDVNAPTTNPLLARPSSDSISPNPVHPQVAPGSVPVMPADNTPGSDYNTICNWIAAVAGGSC